MVVLTDHLHAIWSLPEGDADFAVRWRLIKATFSRGLARDDKYQIAVPSKAEGVFGKRRN